ncbi:MAG: GNAT family N-acetyltransferase, partial [Burkholderiales bacterium]
HLLRRVPAVRATYEQGAAALHQRAPDLRVVIASDAAAVTLGLQRYLALDALHDGAAAAALVPSWYLLGRDAARTAFYRDWLPTLAARGQAQIWLLEASGGDAAALLRLRCGGVWLERHLTQHPAWHDAAPAVHLMVQALAQSWRDGAGESDLLVPPSGLTRSLLGWYDAERPTRRLHAWNLHSRAVVMPMIDRLRGRA